MVCDTPWGLQDIRIIEAPWDTLEAHPPTPGRHSPHGSTCHAPTGVHSVTEGAQVCRGYFEVSLRWLERGPSHRHMPASVRPSDSKGVSTSVSVAEVGPHEALTAAFCLTLACQSLLRASVSPPLECKLQVAGAFLPARRIHGFMVQELLPAGFTVLGVEVVPRLKQM